MNQTQQSQRSHLPPYQQRVLEERDELSDRMGRLYEFNHSAIFTTLPIIEQHLLLKQYAHMTGYLDALDRRIRLFTAFPAPPVAPTAPAPTT